MTIIGNNNNICVDSNSITVNGKRYKVPKGFKYNNVNITNNEVSIKGYTLINDEFVKDNLVKKIKSIFK